MGAPQVVRFAFDYISPFAYLAWHGLQPIAQRHGCIIDPVPVLFAGFLKHHGTLGPAEVPAKRSYLLAHAQRSARELGLPLGLPPAHPFNPLLALRVSCLDMEADVKQRLITSLFDEVWAPAARGITDATIIEEVALKHGLDQVVEQASAKDTKNKLITNTQWAINCGAFGVPSFWVDNSLFWGVDALPHLEHYLQYGDCVEPSLQAQWEGLPGHHRERR